MLLRIAFVFSQCFLAAAKVKQRHSIHRPRLVHLASDSLRSILVIRLSSLGDVLLATPVVRALRRRWVSARIDVAVASSFAEVWKENPYVDNVVEIDKTQSALHPVFVRPLGLAEQQYDVAVDLQRSLRSVLLRTYFAQRSVKVQKYRSQKLELVRHGKRGTRGQSLPHVVERYMETLVDLDCARDHQGLELWLDTDRAAGRYIPAQPSKNVRSHHRVVLAPGAHHATKRWPVAHYAALANSLVRDFQMEVMVVGSTSDQELCHAVAGNAEVAVDVRIMSSLHDSARLMDEAAVVVSNDSGAMHIAAARRRPVVAIFGSTVPEFGFSPYGTAHRIVERALDCRPCTHIGRDSCPLGHFDCLRGIPPGEVSQAVQQLMETDDNR